MALSIIALGIAIGESGGFQIIQQFFITSSNSIGGNVTPGAPFNSVQYNSANVFGGNSLFNYNPTNGLLTVPNETIEYTAYGPGGYLVINIINAQSSATNIVFQQMITLNSLNYAVDEASNLGNIRFYSNAVFTTQNELYSWCESGCNNTGTNAIFWVKLPFSIAATSSNFIYLNFTAITNNYDGNYAGEAPELTTPYAEYDNANSIFTFYDNFRSSTQLTGWNTGHATAVASNGLVVTCTSNGGSFAPCGVSYGVSNFIQPYVAEDFMQTTSGISAFGMISGSNTPSATTSQYNPIFWLDINDNEMGDGYYNGATNLGGSPPAYTTGYKVMQMLAQGGNDLTIGVYNSIYAQLYTNQETNWNQAPGYLTIGGNNNGNAGDTYWARVRVLPPNSIMPSTIFGNVIKAGQVPIIVTGTLNAKYVFASNSMTTSNLNANVVISSNYIASGQAGISNDIAVECSTLSSGLLYVINGLITGTTCT